MKKIRTIDENTQAATPGQLVVSPARFARYHAKSQLDIQMLKMATRMPWEKRNAPIVGPKIKLWTAVTEHFEYGCLNPAVTVDSKLGLVAAFTSLTAVGDQPTPVIKVFREKLALVDGPRPEQGTRFAAVSIYHRSSVTAETGRWGDFSPIVVDCLVDDPAACHAALERLKPLAWEALKLGLAQIPTPPRPGLFHVDIPDDIVKNSY